MSTLLVLLVGPGRIIRAAIGAFILLVLLGAALQPQHQPAQSVVQAHR